jgi:methionyl-tRNA formyltransferase
MKQELKTILFFGNERLATSACTTAPTLRALTEAGYKIEAVIANHTDPVSRQKRDLEIGQVAHSLGIPVILPGHEIPLLEKVKKHSADVGILVAFGKIIPQSVIDLFPNGIVNIHPSMLPLHRGPTPIESVILDGSRETGVSIMRLEQGMDSGPVYAQTTVKLSGHENKQELADILLNEGCKLLIKSLPSILDGSLQPKAQDDSKATYDRLIKKEDGVIDWNKPAQQLEREVRAYLGWPSSKTEIQGNRVAIIEAHVTEQAEDPLDIKCGDGKYLSIDRLMAPSGRKMSARDFVNGYL